MTRTFHRHRRRRRFHNRWVSDIRLEAFHHPKKVCRSSFAAAVAAAAVAVELVEAADMATAEVEEEARWVRLKFAVAEEAAVEEKEMAEAVEF